MNDQLGRIEEDALNVLEDALGWKLSPARWERIGGLLESLEADLARGDMDSVAQVTVQLELAGPVRITRIGAQPTQPPPKVVRERINHLIVALPVKAKGGK